MKKTLVIGASENPERYSNMAVLLLQQHSITTIALGNKAGSIGQQTIITEQVIIEDLDTITLYVGPKVQPNYYQYILSLKPKRIIFNPGTENEELVKLAAENNIESLEACTLVLLKTGQY